MVFYKDIWYFINKKLVLKKEEKIFIESMKDFIYLN